VQEVFYARMKASSCPGCIYVNDLLDLEIYILHQKLQLVTLNFV
jgi:hypothetical protein